MADNDFFFPIHADDDFNIKLKVAQIAIAMTQMLLILYVVLQMRATKQGDKFNQKS
jgi:hypothetical protein